MADIWLREPSAGDLLDLCRNMRALDAKEIFALRDNDSPDQIAMEIYAQLPRAVCAFAIGLDRNPAAIAFLAIWPMDPKGALAAAHMFGTDAFPKVGARLVRYVRRVLIPEMLSRGVRRVEVRVMATHAPARAFLRACGAIEESGPLPDLGKDGEAYILCAWRRSDWRAEHVLFDATPAAGGDHRPLARRRRGGRCRTARAA